MPKPSSTLFEYKTPRDLFPWGSMLVMIALSLLLLRAQGRIWWCKHGDWALYIPDAWNSSHTSQHLFDPYTFTHILHGVFFFWVAILLVPRLSRAWQLTLATAVECLWEIVENSDYVIELYRKNTASLDYLGDSVGNVGGDIFAAMLGFVIAHRIGWRWSIAFFIATELILLAWIRDNLSLNVLMLFFPLQFIKDWQLAISL